MTQLRAVRGRVGMLVAGVLMALSVLLAAMPAADRPLVYHSVDADWTYALHEIFAQKRLFGTEVIFTYGPWGFLLFRYGHPATALPFFVANLFLWSALWIVWWRLLGRIEHPVLRAMACTLILIGGAATIPDGLMYASAATLPVTVTRAWSGAWGRAWSWAGDATIAAGFGLAAWTKFPFLLVIGAAMLLIALDTAVRRRTPGRLPVLWLIAVSLAWLAGGQSAHNLDDFVTRSLELTAAYSQSAGSSPISLAISFVHAIAFFVLAMLLIVRLVRDRASDGIRAWAAALTIAVASTIVMRAGFVRHDTAHQLIAATYLAYVTVMSVGLRVPRSFLDRLVIGTCLAAALLMGAAVAPGLTVAPLEVDYLARFVVRSAASARAHLHGSKLHPHAPCELAGVASDSYSGGQALLIESGAIYEPRPTLQSYLTFDPALAAINRDALVSNKPRQVLFAIQNVDDSLPFVEDGLSWPVLWQRYEPTGAVCHGFAHLQLRSDSGYTPAAPVVAQRGVGSFDQWIALPAGDGASMSSLRIVPVQSPAGAMMAALLRAPSLRLRVKLADGSQESFRVAPAWLRSGVIIDPFVESTASFLAAGWQRGEETRRVVEFMLYAEAAPFEGWKPEYEWAILRIAAGEGRLVRDR